MAHYDTLIFPLAIPLDASGGPKRRSIRVESASGYAVRNQLWATSLRRWDLGGAVRSLGDMDAFVTFFEEAGGNVHSFLLVDPLDHKTCGPAGIVTPTDQAIGTGDNAETDFQLVKARGAVNSQSRDILKPKTVRVALAGVEQSEGTDFTVDYSTGVVTFSSPPGSSVAVTWGGTFYTPARFDFDDDHLEIAMQDFAAGSVVSLPVVEERL